MQRIPDCRRRLIHFYANYHKVCELASDGQWLHDKLRIWNRGAEVGLLKLVYYFCMYGRITILRHTKNQPNNGWYYSVIIQIVESMGKTSPIVFSLIRSFIIEIYWTCLVLTKAGLQPLLYVYKRDLFQNRGAHYPEQRTDLIFESEVMEIPRITEWNEV